MNVTFSRASCLHAASTCLLSLAMLSTAALAAVAPARLPPPQSEFETRTSAAVTAMGLELGEDRTRGYDALLGEAIDARTDDPHGALGLVAFLNQDLDLATWLYGKGVLAEPDNDVYLNNFGLGLHEKALIAGGGVKQRMLLLARDSFAKAAVLQPGNASYLSNLGYAELERWRTDHQPATLEAALVALKKAVAIDPYSVPAFSHLAEALAAKGDKANAAAVLEIARKLGSGNGALIAARSRIPAEVLAEASAMGGARACAISYDCDAKCPRSIIGQIDLVTCKIAESSAQSACGEGKLYAPAFDCAEKIPEFGILIPGLNSGFSMPTPFGRLDMTVDGAGNVEFRFKWSTSVAPGVSAGVTTRGQWSPSSGFSKVEFKEGVSYSVVGGDAAKMMGEMKMGPYQITIDRDVATGKMEMKSKAYGGAVFTH